MIRYQMQFFGLVQQVGFRFYTQQFAKKNNCTGWVKNCDDGTVLMEIQGDQKQIDQVILSLYAIDHIQIESIKKQEIPIKDEHDFVYRFN